jgi:1-acyl-sn-glycerol-3-phosphate acyltransferase
MENSDLTNDKVINSMCYCKTGLGWEDLEVIMLEPCEHLIHKKCYNIGNNCKICNNKVTKYYTINKLKKLIIINPSRYYQKYVDLLSITNFNNKSIQSTKKSMLYGIPKFLDFFYSTYKAKNMRESIICIDKYLSMCNSKIIVEGKENIIEGKKVFIGNHMCDIDLFVIISLFKCGALCSTDIFSSPFGYMFATRVPMVFINRGKKGCGTVNKMKNLVDTYGSIVIFPEGLYSHPNTLTRFGTGAFNIGYPIHPIIIKYNPIIYDSDQLNFIFKMLSCKNLVIKLTILPCEYPPFTPEKIENIRKKMAEKGNFALSRVSNRDITDKLDIPPELINGFYPQK